MFVGALYPIPSATELTAKMMVGFLHQLQMHQRITDGTFLTAPLSKLMCNSLLYDSNISFCAYCNSVNSTQTHFFSISTVHQFYCALFGCNYVIKFMYKCISEQATFKAHSGSSIPHFHLMHTGREKKCHLFADDIFKCICMNFVKDFTEVCSYSSSWQHSSIGSDNGLVQTRRQAIFWTSDFTDAYMHHSASMTWQPSWAITTHYYYSFISSILSLEQRSIHC